jgi:hypothetical protein
MSALRIKKRTKPVKPLIVDQWVEVEVKDGVTTTTRYPGDEEVLTCIAEKTKQTGREVDMVYRRLNFVHGVPPEYGWTTKDPMKIKYGGHSIQRLRVEDWKDLLPLEAGGHMMGCRYYMPRPEASGGCECSSCRAATARIAEKGR